MFTLGVILARSGSNGLRNKHLLPLMGRPLIQYTFERARESARLSLTVVSSDCPRILAIANEEGFATIQRPPELATDEASVQDVLLHAMDDVGSTHRVRIDAVATLYGNVPIRPAGVIDEAIQLLAHTGCDSVRSFCPVGKWHPQWMSRIDGDRAVANMPGSVHRRQDLEALYLHDGAIVVSNRASMDVARGNRSDPHAFFGTDRRAVVTQVADTVEVDTRRDLLLAEAILRDQMPIHSFSEAKVA